MNINISELRQLIHIEVKNLLQGKSSATTVAQLQKKLLPPPLMARMTCPEAFYNAISEGLIAIDNDGKMTWTVERMLQVYFFGRLFCGDKAIYSKALDKYIWRQNKCSFPDGALTKLFGISLGKMRNKRKNLAVPKNFQYIDRLFAN